MTAADLLAELYEVFERRALARLMGVSETTLWWWASGNRAPRPRHLAALHRLHDLLPEIRAAARDTGRAERLIV